MTPIDAWLIACGFVGLLLALTALLEQTEAGRSFTDRAIDWITR